MRMDLVAGRIDPSLPHPARVLVNIVHQDVHRPDASPGPERLMKAAGRQEELRAVVADGDFDEWSRSLPVQVGVIGPLVEERERFTVAVTLERRADEMRAAVYSVDKRTWDAWWAEVERRVDAGSVRPVSAGGAISAPRGRGGAPWDPGAGDALTAATSDVAAPSGCTSDDTWNNGSLDVMPLARNGHTAVWTGS